MTTPCTSCWAAASIEKRCWDPVVGLVVGSYQGCSEALETLAHEAAEAMACSDWNKMGARSEDEALGIFMQSVRRRWGAA